MSKPSQIDKAIAQLEGEVAVLQMAIQKLKAQQQGKAHSRRPRVDFDVAPRAVVAKAEQSA